MEAESGAQENRRDRVCSCLSRRSSQEEEGEGSEAYIFVAIGRACFFFRDRRSVFIPCHQLFVLFNVR